MSGDSDHPVPLPAKDFCNSWGKGNPILGKGALGNFLKEKMYYQGGNKESLVTTVQLMLTDLGYDVGSKGADGKFGDETEKAVKAFQTDHKDWNGNSLKVDGLVGPETGDALNRKMVGLWYDSYSTPREFTKEYKLLTITTEALKNAFKVDVDGEKSIKIVLKGEISPRYPPQVELQLQLFNSLFEPLRSVHYRLEIDDSNYDPSDAEGDTDQHGVLSKKIPRSAKKGRLFVLDSILNLNIINTDLDPTGMVKGAILRLGNLNYLDIPQSLLSESGEELQDVNQFSDMLKTAVMNFQFDHELQETGELNQETVKKLEERYGR